MLRVTAASERSEITGDDVNAGLRIEARDLRKSFEGGRVEALTGMNLSVGEGEHLAIMGPTGCGKSTLLSILALLDQADSGSLSLGGLPAESITNRERWRAEYVGIVFQFHHLLPYLSAEENVMLSLAARGFVGKPARKKAHETLESIGLAHRSHAPAAKLSGGERQLTAVARAIVGKPSFILADEPTGSVDSKTGRRVLDILLNRELNPGATVILITHDSRIAARADRMDAVVGSAPRFFRRTELESCGRSAGDSISGPVSAHWRFG